jgi:hypothetical protein
MKSGRAILHRHDTGHITLEIEPPDAEYVDAGVEFIREYVDLLNTIQVVQDACEEALVEIPMPAGDFRRGYNTMAKIVTNLLEQK